MQNPYRSLHQIPWIPFSHKCAYTRRFEAALVYVVLPGFLVYKIFCTGSGSHTVLRQAQDERGFVACDMTLCMEIYNTRSP